MVAPSARGNDASVDRPRFRQDLVAEAVEDGGNKFIDVADPDTGNVFRFFEVEFSIACAMDGQRDAAGIRDWAKEELGLMPSLNEVRNVIASLKDLGFIEAGSAGAAAGAAAAAAEANKPAEAPTRPTPPPPAAQQQSAAPKAAVAKGATLSGPAVMKPASPAQADKDLAAGIVVGAKGSSAPTEDVELGRAGASAAAAQAPMPKSADIALGAPGASASPKPPKIPVEDVALGNAGAKDVSLDLADHVAVGKDDLKEAVRQSKVMTAVEIPKDLQDALEEKKPAAAAPAPVVAKAPEPAKAATPATPPASKQEPAQQSAKGDQGGKKGKKGKDKSQPVQQVKAPEPAKQPEAKKAEPAKQPEAKKPEPAKQDAKKAEPAKADTSKQGNNKGNQQAAKGEKKPVAPVPPPEPEQKTSGALIGLLIVVLLAGGAFLVWKYVLNKKTDTGSVSTTAPVKPTTPKQPEKPTPPPAPPMPKAQIAMTTPMPAPQYSKFPGKLESIIGDGDVKKGDIIATLEGARKSAPQRQKIEKELKKFQDQAVAAVKLRDEAKASNDAAAEELNKKYEAAMLKVNEKQAELDKFNEEASKLEIMASHDGKMVGVARAGADIKEETLIANIAQNPAPLVTFKFAEGEGTRYDHGTAQVVMSGSELVTCTVAESTPEALTLECPQNEFTKDGTELTFRAPTAHAN
jgi:hypothetical protein